MKKIPKKYLIEDDSEMVKIGEEMRKKLEAFIQENKEEEKHKGEKAPDKCE